ncbi:MAG: hypothetical protein ETSY1_38075 [Candidatus Entotheonella factor]|uniref:TIGR02453 family protein n=1 Tax=Entotheonella factor TaxID=1429438 RepID=W4L6I5_ENTF1|nr:MAG: hypothetical protein ETSY1_38075 [Candidatus Entotheonella factor]
MAEQPYFHASLFQFLVDLRFNNDREWFQANKKRYESEVRDPMLRFIADVGPHLETVSKRFVADPRPRGGSLFRIHRDVRFSKDKSPYKTNVGAHFRHEVGRDVHAPGFYLHLEPGQVFIAGGVWHPSGSALTKIRDAIVENPKAWQQATSSPVFCAVASMGGDSLKRPPKGYEPDHPLIEELKRKDFIAHADFSEEQACAPDFMDVFTQTCQAFAPMAKFLTTALELPW